MAIEALPRTASGEALSPTTAHGACVKASCPSKLDLATTIPLFLLAILLEVMKLWYPRFFVERDPSLSHPLVPSSVGTLLLVFLAVVLPGALLIGLQARGLLGRQTSLCAVLFPYGLAHTMQWLTVGVMKGCVGRLRPNFFALCDYRGYHAAVGNPTLLEEYLKSTVPGVPGSFEHCLANAKANADGHLSFPSGHTSSAFTGLGFLGFAAALAVRGRRWPSSAQAAALLGPLILAAWIASTRIREYWHREDDVVAGAIIGLVAARWAFIERLLPACAGGGLVEKFPADDGPPASEIGQPALA